MSHVRLAARVRNRAGALERVVGLIRRHVLPVRRMSIAESDNVIEMLLRLEADETVVERVRADLLELYDVIEVGVVETPHRTIRELVLVRLPLDAPAGADAAIGRRIAADADGITLEITGAPEEVDRALEWLRGERLITGFVRTGEVVVPGEPSLQQRSDA